MHPRAGGAAPVPRAPRLPRIYMGRPRTGSIRKRRGKWWVRVSWQDDEGRRHRTERSVPTRALATDLLHQLLHQTQEQPPADDRLTFRELAERYRQHKVFAAEYVGERKVAGLRDARTAAQRLQVLTDYFGDKLVRSITPAALERFKRDRLAEPVRYGKGKTRQRSITTVNRELELLRALLFYAERENVIPASPFRRVKGLISAADETKRHRILSREEEERLLAACTGARAHLRPLLITAVETGMRRGELLALRWQDVRFEDRLIVVRATTTKTLSERLAPITPRVECALRGIRPAACKPDDLVFGLKKFQTGFEAACRAAGIKGLRFHDLRATAITRMLQAGVSAQLVMRVSGHTQPTTFLRYTRASDAEIIGRIIEALAPGNEAERRQFGGAKGGG